MPKSEAEKRATAKWDRENMVVISAKVRKEKADKYRAFCAKRGQTASKNVLEYIDRCISEDTGASESE